jgi:hypothetical protein
MPFKGAGMAKDCGSESTQSHRPFPIAYTFIEVVRRERHLCGHLDERTRRLDEDGLLALKTCRLHPYLTWAKGCPDARRVRGDSGELPIDARA